jgi:hypothetical protein
MGYFQPEIPDVVQRYKVLRKECDRLRSVEAENDRLRSRLQSSEKSDLSESYYLKLEYEQTCFY